MSDVPSCAPVARLTSEERRLAAITTCELADYDRQLVEDQLLALGLIERANGIYVTTHTVDGTTWCTSQASRANA